VDRPSLTAVLLPTGLTMLDEDRPLEIGAGAVDKPPLAAVLLPTGLAMLDEGKPLRIGRPGAVGIEDPVPRTDVSFPDGYGADGIAEVESGELSWGDEAGTVTVTVFAEVTVTVAGPHWLPAEDRPVGELSEPERPEALPELPPMADDTGSGMTVTVLRVPIPVPVPVGPLTPVELPNSYGAEEEPIGLKPLPDAMGTPVEIPLGRGA